MSPEMMLYVVIAVVFLVGMIVGAIFSAIIYSKWWSQEEDKFHNRLKEDTHEILSLRKRVARELPFA